MKKTLQLLERHLGAFFLLYSLLLLGLAIYSPIVGDYCSYLQQWHNVYRGFDPWANNAKSPRDCAYSGVQFLRSLFLSGT